MLSITSVEESDPLLKPAPKWQYRSAVLQVFAITAFFGFAQYKVHDWWFLVLCCASYGFLVRSFYQVPETKEYAAGKPIQWRVFVGYVRTSVGPSFYEPLKRFPRCRRREN